MNHNHDTMAEKFAQDIIQTLHNSQAKPDPETLETYCHHWVNQVFYSKHYQAKRAVARRVYAIVQQEVGA